MSTMNYMGYAAHLECSDEDACFVGRIDVADCLIWYNTHRPQGGRADHSVSGILGH